jgi:hypothetical protein
LTFATGALFLSDVDARFRQTIDKTDELRAAIKRSARKLVGLLPNLQRQIAESKMQIHLSESPVSFFYELQ